MEPETLSCPECGAENAADAEACLACGADVSAAGGPLAKIPTPALLAVVALVLIVVLGALAKSLYEKSRPSSHTQAGYAALEAKDYAGAQREFKAALGYDRKYELAIVGLARVGAEGGEASLVGTYAKDAIARLEKGSIRANLRVAYAWSLLEQGNARDANNQAIEALDDDPEVAGADALRGLSALQLNPPSEEDALLYLKKAVGKESDKLEVYRSLCQLLLTREDFESGSSVARQGLKLSSEDGGLWLLLARHRRGLKDLRGEGEALRKALEVDDKNAEVHGLLSHVLLQLEDAPGSLIHAKRAAEIAPEDAEAQLALGRILLVNGKPLNARQALEKAQRIRSDSWEIDYLLGKAQAQTDDASRGIRAMIKALSGREKEHPDLIEETAELGVEKGVREASGFLQAQVKTSDSYALHYLYAKSMAADPRAAKGKEREIKTHLERCLRVDPRRKEAPLLLGNFYRELGKVDDAINAWELGLKYHERDAELLRAKGEACLRAERWDEAISALERLVNVLPDDRPARDKLKAAQDGKFFSKDR